jgi:hypothetical protein
MSIDTNRLQRALNEHKRQYLCDHYGARFPRESSDMSPEAEGQWLDSVAEIEAACATAGEVTVREYLGAPSVKLLGEIPPCELRAELEALEDLLMDNHIMVTFVQDVSDGEAYRYLSEDLLETRIENVRFPMWFTLFMYHPLLGAKRIGMSMTPVIAGEEGGRQFM